MQKYQGTFALGCNGRVNNSPEVIPQVEEAFPHHHSAPSRILKLLHHPCW
jgi:hypothetical protein